MIHHITIQGKIFLANTREEVIEKVTKSLESGDLHIEHCEGKHRVQPGETLWGIAKLYYGDGDKYPVIFAANRDMLKRPEQILPDTILNIPLEK